MQAARLHWMRGRQEEGPGVHRTLEWIGRNDAGEAIARVVRILGPVWTGWRSYRAVALDAQERNCRRPGNQTAEPELVV
jgi:hypothetical protein